MRARSSVTLHNLVLASRARGMRFALTASEQRLWQAIRGGRLGVPFRRQAVLGRYIVDFLAPAARLVVEVDGGYHARRRHADGQRDVALARLGYRVLRLEARLVERELDAVVPRIREALAAV